VTVAAAVAAAAATTWAPAAEAGVATATLGVKAAARGGVEASTGRGRGQGLDDGVADSYDEMRAMTTDQQGREAAAAGAVEAGGLLTTRQRQRMAPRNRTRTGRARATAMTGTNRVDWTIRDAGGPGRSRAAAAARNGECLACDRVGLCD
jgi:hypothetical protein